MMRAAILLQEKIPLEFVHRVEWKFRMRICSARTVAQSCELDVEGWRENIFCKKCGTRNAESTPYCRKCGAKVGYKQNGSGHFNCNDFKKSSASAAKEPKAETVASYH